MKTYWISDSRFKFIALLLMIIFFTIMAFLYFQSEAIIKSPCSICAEKMGSDVVCRLMDGRLLTKTFFENGTVTNNYLGG